MGGSPSSYVGRLVEIFPPSSSLSIPSLPQGKSPPATTPPSLYITGRWGHSLTLLPGPPPILVICGGWQTESSCISYSGGQGAWQEFYTMK